MPAFELTILFSALTGIFGMLAINGLPAFYHPLFNVADFERASDDRFFLCIESADKKFDKSATGEFLQRLNPLKVTEVAR